MPIKVNLLAEAQIAEDLRRRDPVKRAIFAGSFLVVLALAWSSSLELEAVINKSELAHMQAQIQSRTNEWLAVVDNEKKISEEREKLSQLQKLSASRFLQGNFLNALQSLNYDGVELASVKVNQLYTSYTPPAAPPEASSDSPAPPARSRAIVAPKTEVTEKIVLSIDARDVSPSPGDQVNKFKQSLAGQEYFKKTLSTTNGVQLTSLSPLQTGPSGKAFELFTLECSLPPKTQ
jgi:hypothetical protein